MASASADAADSDNPPVNLASATADTTTNCASHPILSLQRVSSARLEVSLPEASPLTSIPAPSTASIHDSDSVEFTPSATRSENVPAPLVDPGPAQIDSGEVSETPALVGSGGTSDANPQETELSSTEIPSLSRPAVQLSGKEDPSE